MTQKKTKLVIDAWPQLITFLNHEAAHGVTGSTAEEVAKFLIVKGLDDRARERNANRKAGHEAYAGGYRGNL